jgi:hypothetical protein
MAAIYENAFLTIAATKSPDSSGGCFSKFEPQYEALCPIPRHILSSKTSASFAAKIAVDESRLDLSRTKTFTPCFAFLLS